MKKVFSIGMVVLACATLVATGQAQPMLKFEQGLIHVAGLPTRNPSSTITISEGQWSTILRVYTHEAYIRKIDQPVGGSYTWHGDSILFKPTYPFSPGDTYHAVFSIKEFHKSSGISNESSGEDLELSFSPPARNFPSTEVLSVYPESAVLPENLLRMYIYFSAPMMPGEAYNHIRLMREDGRRVEKAFLIVDQELWDTDRTRFTLLFDPGRIKRDLKSNIDLGTPLQAGETYHLLIDSAWRDAHGNALGKSIQKTFTVVEAERTTVSPRRWKLIPPLEGTVSEIVVSFDRPMDHALALKSLSIQGPSGKVTGRAKTLGDNTWSFTPDHPWVAGDYMLAILPLLEDVAGNNLNNVFDLDLTKESRVNSVEPVELPFSIRIIAR